MGLHAMATHDVFFIFSVTKTVNCFFSLLGHTTRLLLPTLFIDIHEHVPHFNQWNMCHFWDKAFRKHVCLLHTLFPLLAGCLAPTPSYSDFINTGCNAGIRTFKSPHVILMCSKSLGTTIVGDSRTSSWSWPGGPESLMEERHLFIRNVSSEL